MRKGKHFTAALKANRLVALSQADKEQGRYERIYYVSLPEKQSVRGWLQGDGKRALLVRQVFKNKYTGMLNLMCRDLPLDVEQVTTIFQKQWNVEAFHKSLKSNAGLAKSPTKTVTTQSNHVFRSIAAVFKLECSENPASSKPFRLARKIVDQGNPASLPAASGAMLCARSFTRKELLNEVSSMFNAFGIKFTINFA